MKFANFIQWLNNSTIRRKLVFTFLVITVLPLSLLAYLSNRSSRQALTQAANSSLFSVASQTAESIDSFISTEMEIIQIEAQFPLFQEYLTLSDDEQRRSELEIQVQDYLKNLITLHGNQEGDDEEYLLGFSLLNRSGTILVDTHSFSGETNLYLGSNWSERNYFNQPILLGVPYSSSIEIPQEGQFSSIYFSARIANELDHPLGVLVAHYDANILQEIIREKNDLAGPGSFGAVFDENLIYLAHGTHPDLLFTTVAELDETLLADLQRVKRLPELPPSEIISISPELQSGLESALPVFSAKDPVTGELVNQVAAVGLNNRPWQVAFFQPENVFLEPSQQQTANILLFSVLITSLSLAAALLAARGLGVPIIRLTAIAEKVAAGDLNARAEISSQDEIGILAQTFNGMTNQLRQTLEGLEHRVSERTNLLQVSIEVGRAASAILNSDELIHRVVNLITDRFGYYYAAIFLVDVLGEWAELKGATGEAGKTLLAQRHRLRVGGQSMVGTAILSRQGRIALDVGEESVRFRNPLLSGTRSELALPLMVGDEAIGALDVQSTIEGAFGEQDIETMQNMANQVAIAIQNARLYQQAQQQLTEISRLNQSLMREGWQSFFKAKPNPGLQYTQNQLKEISSPEIPELNQSLQERGPVYNYQNNKATLTLPLILREQVIGILNLKADKKEWSQDDLTIINTVTRQAALAFENARLVEASQQLAARERQINQITAHIYKSADMEAILKTTLTELATVLNVQEASIQLSHAKSSGNSQNGSTQ
jgi:GAF domain-containing protein/HAMP domain-containing protein